jgi:DNA-binding NtrC family response regulator
VRELYNAVARLIALGQEELPGAEVAQGRGLSESQRDYLDVVIGLDLPLVPARQRVVEEFERRYVMRLLERYQGDTQRAATAAGIARRYFQILRARRSTDG